MDKLELAYSKQRRQALRRGIPWLFTFAEWLRVWEESGFLLLRGTGKGKYVMSRLGDAGPYSVDNVRIQLGTQNNKEAADLWRGKRKETPGIYLIYPGADKPWQAKYAKQSLGYFATAAEALAARTAYMEANNLRNNSEFGCAAKGYQKQFNRYVMRAAGRRSTHDTPEEARAAYLEAIEAIRVERAAASSKAA